MLLSFWNTIKPVIFWNYRRGSWQYDLIVAGILAFIFLTPADSFHDGPRAPRVEQIEAVGPGGEQVFLVTAEALKGVPEAEQDETLLELIEAQVGRTYSLVRTKASRNDEGEVRSYVVYAKPAA